MRSLNTVRTIERLDFRPLAVQDRARYEEFLFKSPTRGCEYSFANRFLWGEQEIAEWKGMLLLRARFSRVSYPWPLGRGDLPGALDAIRRDAAEQGIPCRITGMLPEEAAQLEALDPGAFRFEADRGSFDYVYEVDALATLAGRKLHGKRNHLHRFEENHPGATVEVLDETLLPAARAFVQSWFAERPEGDFAMEQVALERAFASYRALGLEGLLLRDGDQILAVTMGSRLSNDTFDVHFEKARADVEGAYTAINRAFARHVQERFPEIRYLDREEDMGLESLRTAKLSYRPHHLLEKQWAVREVQDRAD
jgi:hypothetical protein